MSLMQMAMMFKYSSTLPFKGPVIKTPVTMQEALGNRKCITMEADEQ